MRQFASSAFDSLAEINFLENPGAINVVAQASDADDLFFRLSALTNTPLEPGRTLLFLDEIQECQDLLTWVKFLSDRSGLAIVLSGSLLGPDTYVHVRSPPVGFLQKLTMHPLDFEEFCWANGMLPEVFDRVRASYHRLEPVPDFLHERLMSLFYTYLLIGGMPDAVQAFVDTHDSATVRAIQRSIVELYADDVTTYVADPLEARQIKMVYEAIPAQLNAPSKRFKYTRLGKQLRFANLETAFDWLTQAGIAIAVPHVGSPEFPLGLAEDRSKFKLFPNDVGLLTSQLMGTVDVNLLNRQGAINYGSIFEAVTAQELVAHGHTPRYLASKGTGEVDFVIESTRTGQVLPIEVKSGKDYKRHSALSNLLGDPARGIARAVVLHDGNLEVKSAVHYLPIYMAGVVEA